MPSCQIRIAGESVLIRYSSIDTILKKWHLERRMQWNTLKWLNRVTRLFRVTESLIDNKHEIVR